MQRAGGVALFPEARDERMRRLPSTRGCTARLCFGPKPGGTHENETSRAGLRPEDIYVYVERSQGRANRPFLVVSPEREARVREADALAGVRAPLPETKPHVGRQTSTEYHYTITPLRLIMV